MAVAHRLDPLFNFKSIAVVGASDSGRGGPRGLGAWQALGNPGPYYPVNARADTVAGMRAYKSVAALPEVPDMVMIVVPRRFVADIIDECADLGVKAAVIVSAGFVEADEEGAALQARITATARSRGPLVIGPNCLGLLSVANRCGAFGGTPPQESGPIALLSHSGGLMNEVLSAGASRGLRFSHVVSAGNEAGVTSADILDYYVADPGTDVILSILETARDPEGFLAACGRARAAGKPIVLLKMGRSQKGHHSAFTHTGARAGNDDVYAAMFREQGITQVNDLDELIDMGMLFAAAKPILQAGHRLEKVGIIEISGGGKELACDTFAAAGVHLPELSEAAEVALRQVLDEEYPTTNPLDSGGGWGDADKAEVYPAAMEVFATEPNIDVIVSRYTIPSSGGLGPLDQRLTEMAAAREAHPDKLFLVLSRTTDMWAPSWQEAITTRKVPFLQGYGRGPRALAHLARYSRFLHGPDPREETRKPPELLVAATRPANAAEVSEVLRSAGIVESVASSSGGVALVLGARRDAAFGPVVRLGSSPAFVAEFGDVVWRLAPVTASEAEALLDQLRGQSALAGINRAAVGEALASLARLLTERTDLVEIELNPAVVTPTGVVAGSARVAFAS